MITQILRRLHRLTPPPVKRSCALMQGAGFARLAEGGLEYDGFGEVPPPHKKQYDFSRGGFTFIELLVIIVIIGVLSATAIPQFRRTFDAFTLENFTKDIYYLSRYLQDSAVSQGKIYFLNIDPNEGKFWAVYKAEDKFNKVEGNFGKVFKAPEGISIFVGEAGEIEKNGVYFYPDGSCEDITIGFKNKNNEQRSLNIKGAVGEIKIE